MFHSESKQMIVERGVFCCSSKESPRNGNRAWKVKCILRPANAPSGFEGSTFLLLLLYSCLFVCWE